MLSEVFERFQFLEACEFYTDTLCTNSLYEDKTIKAWKSLIFLIQ